MCLLAAILYEWLLLKKCKKWIASCRIRVHQILNYLLHFCHKHGIILIRLDNNEKNFNQLNICLLHSIHNVIYIYIIKQHSISVQR